MQLLGGCDLPGRQLRLPVPGECRCAGPAVLRSGHCCRQTGGFHAHNNQNLAFANTIETLSYGVSYLDATAMGMGRGAGNCAMELLLGFLKNPKYSLYSLLLFIEKYMIPLREAGVQWGFDLQYMFTGQLNRHPREAMNFTAQHRTDYCEFYKSLLDND